MLCRSLLLVMLAVGIAVGASAETNQSQEPEQRLEGFGPDVHQQVADDDELREKVESLIEQLGDERYSERERAHAALVELGPKIIPLIEPHFDHPDAEIAARLRTLKGAYEWMGHGALVFRIEPGSQAEQLDIKPGDVALRINRLDVHSIREIRQVPEDEHRTLKLLTTEGIRTVDVEPGRIGIWLSEWREDEGGQAHLEGIRALADEATWPRAYELIGDLHNRGIDEPWTAGVMAGLSVYMHEHERAMRLYDQVARQPGPTGDLEYLLGELAERMPLEHLEVARALDRVPRLERTSGEEQAALERLFTRRAPNRAILNRLLDVPEEAVEVDDMPMRLLRTSETRAMLALHQRNWQQAAESLTAVCEEAAARVMMHQGGDPDPNSPFVTAAASLRDFLPVLIHLSIAEDEIGQARSFAETMIRTAAGDQIDYRREDFAAAAMIAWLQRAAGQAAQNERSTDFAARFASLRDEQLVDLWSKKLHRLARHGDAATALRPYFTAATGEDAPAAAKRGVAMMVLADREAGHDDWESVMAILNDEQREELDFAALEVLAQLRFGRFDEARDHFDALEPTKAQRDRFNEGIELLERAADRAVDNDWNTIEGAVHAVAADDDGAWLVRHDGRVFHLDWHEGPRPAEGLPAGAAPVDPRYPPIEQINGELYWHDDAMPGSLPYHFDAEGRQWRPVGIDDELPAIGALHDRLLRAARVAASRHIRNADTGPDPLPLLVAAHDLGDDRLLIRLEQDRTVLAAAEGEEGGDDAQLAAGAWREEGGIRTLDLGKAIAGKLEVDESVSTYHALVQDAGEGLVLLPTSHGLWAVDIDEDMALRQIDLGLDEQAVPVRIMSWPKREGRIYVGAAPQAGGRIVELRGAGLEPHMTNGFNGKGPHDEFATDLPTITFERALRHLRKREAEAGSQAQSRLR